MHTRIQALLRTTYNYIPFHVCLLTFVIVGMQVYNAGIFGDPDAQYHLSVAKNLPLWPHSTSFYWLPFTSWGSAFADQHYLFHAFLKPFALVNLELVATVFGFIANLLAFNWLLKVVTKSNRAPWLWLYVLGSTDLLVRINLIKAETTGLVFLFLLVGMLIQKRWTWLLPLMCLYTLWYGASTVFLAILGAYCLAETAHQRTLVLKPIIYTLLGLLLALAVHPYRTTLPALLYDQITAAGFLRQVPGGNEWYAHPEAFLKDNILIFLPWLVSLLYGCFRKNPHGTTTLFLSVASILLLCAGLFTTRMLIYWVPFAVLLSASTLAHPLREYMRKTFNDATQRVRQKLIVIICLFIGIRMLENVYGISTAVHTIGIPASRLRPAAVWLRDHTNPGDIVTNSSWHIFPELLYWNTQNRYIAGEDPAFLWLGDMGRYKEWSSLQNTSITPKAYALVLQALNSKWVIVPITNTTLTDNSYFEQTYADAEVRVLHLRK